MGKKANEVEKEINEQNKLLKEENHRLRLENNDLEAQVKKVRMKTAKEIFQELYDEAVGQSNEVLSLTAYYIKNTLAKSYGVEVE